MARVWEKKVLEYHEWCEIHGTLQVGRDIDFYDNCPYCGAETIIWKKLER